MICVRLRSLRVGASAASGKVTTKMPTRHATNRPSNAGAKDGMGRGAM